MADRLKPMVGVLVALNVAWAGAALTLPADTDRAREDVEQRHALEVAPERVTVLSGAVDDGMALCVQLARFTPSDYLGLRAWLAEKGIATQAQITLERAPGWWTFIPPGPVSPPVLLLRAMHAGISEPVWIQKGPVAGAVALGIFNTEAQACAARDELLAKGLAEVNCGPRPLPTAAQLVLGGLDESAAPAVLQAVNQRLPNVGATLLTCPVPAAV